MPASIPNVSTCRAVLGRSVLTPTAEVVWIPAALSINLPPDAGGGALILTVAVPEEMVAVTAAPTKLIVLAVPTLDPSS